MPLNRSQGVSGTWDPVQCPEQVTPGRGTGPGIHLLCFRACSPKTIMESAHFLLHPTPVPSSRRLHPGPRVGMLRRPVSLDRGWILNTSSQTAPDWDQPVPVPAGDRSRATSGGPVSGRPRGRRLLPGQLEVTWAQAGPSGN